MSVEPTGHEKIQLISKLTKRDGTPKKVGVIVSYDAENYYNDLASYAGIWTYRGWLFYNETSGTFKVTAKGNQYPNYTVRIDGSFEEQEGLKWEFEKVKSNGRRHKQRTRKASTDS